VKEYPLYAFLSGIFLVVLAFRLTMSIRERRKWLQGRLPAKRFGRQFRLRLEDIERAAQPSIPPDLLDRASLAAMAELWDNEEDAIYDNWRELYGVEEG
jgi:heme exporter protein D